MIAPFSSTRARLLASSIGPVTKVPAGTITSPPPALRQAAIAFRNGSVFRVLPSPTAPKLVMTNFRWGTTGSCGLAVTSPLRCAQLGVAPTILRVAAKNANATIRTRQRVINQVSWKVPNTEIGSLAIETPDAELHTHSLPSLEQQLDTQLN